MKENSIEEDIKILEEKMNKELNFLIENANKTEQLTAISIIAMKEPIILLFLSVLSDYKRVLKENEILKEEKAEFWDEWNNLERGSYETEQKLRQQVKKLQKENEELKEELKEENELNKIIKDTKLDELFCRRNGKKVEQAIKLRDELLKLPECKLYGIKKCKKSVILIIKEEVIPIQKVKDKIEELNNLSNAEELEDIMNKKDYTITELVQYVLQELLEGRKEREE